MRLIFSRKGWDSSAGGGASPLLPGGRLLALPIPDPGAALRYRELRAAGVGIGALVEQLSGGRVRGADRAHLDPDLRADALAARPASWRPAFGQHGAALSHLEREGVGRGDVFLFFGWHRAVERHRRRWRYRPGAPDQHLLTGWLRVGAVWRAGEPVPAAIATHRHCDGDFGARNAVYIASEHWRGAGGRLLPGAGCFERWRPPLVLSADAASCAALDLAPRRSLWRLPRWAAPDPAAGRAGLSYHRRAERWRQCGDAVLLSTVGRGQEFVLDIGTASAPRAWLEALIGTAGPAQQPR